MTSEAINSVTPTHWKAYVRHVRAIEVRYCETDGRIETAVDATIINLNQTNNDEETSSSDEDDIDETETENGLHDEDNLSGIDVLEPQPSTSHN